MQRNANHGRSEPAPEGSETTLGRCLVDGDPDATLRARRACGKALGVSLAIEISLLAFLVATPLFNSVARPSFKSSSPVSFVLPAKIADRMPPQGDTERHSSSPILRSMFLYPAGPSPRQPAHSDVEETDSTAPAVDSLYDSPAGFASLFGERPTRPGSSATSPEVARRNEGKRPLRLSEPVVEAQLIRRVEPRYPPLAVQARREGTVVLHAIISRDGAITSLEVVRGDPLFVSAALDAVRQWRYRPTMLDGEPVEVETTITVEFRLRN